MSSELHLPLNLPFPIRIVSLDARPPASVPRGSRLLSYSFAHTAAVSDVSPETRFGTWDSPIDGTLDTWKVKAGELITLKRAREKAAVVITEPCTHESQIAGMCTLCGKDMTMCVMFNVSRKGVNLLTRRQYIAWTTLGFRMLSARPLP